MVPVMVALACHPAGSSASNKRSRSSKVLDDFKNSLNHTMVVGFAFLVNVISAKKKTLSARLSSGTGHLLRHIKSCRPRTISKHSLCEEYSLTNKIFFLLL